MADQPESQVPTTIRFVVVNRDTGKAILADAENFVGALEKASSFLGSSTCWVVAELAQEQPL